MSPGIPPSSAGAAQSAAALVSAPTSGGGGVVQRLPPPLPLRAGERVRFREAGQVAQYEGEIAPVWTQPFAQLLLSQVTPLAKGTVLDAMCHAAEVGLPLIRRSSTARLVAIDGSTGLLDVARRRAGPLLGRRAFFRSEPGEPDLPFDTDVYDLVVSNLGLFEAAQPRRLLRELIRVAKPGALIGATTPVRGSFAEFYELWAPLLQGRPREAAQFEKHVAAVLEPGTLYDWALEAGLEEVSVTVQPFSLLFAGGIDFFFAPVVEYGLLPGWKAILGEPGPEMQAAFAYLRDAIDAACLPEGAAAHGAPRGTPPGPFVLTARAACLRARKPAVSSPLRFEDDPNNAPTNPGV